jgi:aldoxime dehydratase
MLPVDPASPYWLEAQCRDGAGYDTRVIIAYWQDAKSFTAWRQASGFDAWWSDPARETEPLGRFMEVAAPPMDRLEVAYSPPHLPGGAGNLQSRVSACPVAEHAYWGSARDRIPASQSDALDNNAGTLALTRNGARVRVEPEQNVCMIRSGQDWSDTMGDERATYLGRVRPKLTPRKPSARPISAASAPSNIGRSIIRRTSPSSARSCTRWRPVGDAMQLRLWHDVMALPAQAQSFEYVNCHERTGLMGAAAP